MKVKKPSQKGKADFLESDQSEDLNELTSQMPHENLSESVAMDDKFSEQVKAMASDPNPAINREPDDEIRTIFKLLKSLSREGLSNAEKISVTDELLRWARLIGAGDLGKRGEEYKRAREAVSRNEEIRKVFVGYLESNSSEVRAWAASFIEQLFDNDEAVNFILEALSHEKEAIAAPWMALSLARLQRGEPRTCDIIAETYKRFMKADNSNVQIARAWGHAGCQESAPVLAGFLIDGTYNQKNVAINGLRGLGRIEDFSVQPIIAEVMLMGEEKNIRDKCANLLNQFNSYSQETIDLLRKYENASDELIRSRAKNFLASVVDKPFDSPPVQRTQEGLPPDTNEFFSRYTSDMPLGDKVVDCIDVETEARAFAKITAATEVHPPLAIGIFGEWGSGKTFFMERIYANVIDLTKPINKDERKSPFCQRVVQIRFNAWHYMESNLWASLVDYIFQELDLWLHQHNEKQTTINALFDQLSTARQLKLESVQAVINARKERHRAAVRLDTARQDYESAVISKSSFSSKAFWNAVIQTFKKDLNEADRKSIDDASKRLGFAQLAESAESLNATIEEATSQAGRAKVLARATIAKLGHGKTLFCTIALLALLPLGLVVLRAVLANVHPQSWFDKINDFTLGIIGIITAATSCIGFASNRAVGALNTLTNFHEALGKAIKSETEKPEHDFAAAKREVATKEADLEQAEQNLAHADERVESAVKEWTASTPRGRLNRFIREKVIGGDYAKHLGIVAAIRKDFGQLAQMVSEGSSDQSSLELYKKSQEEYLAEVERLIAEASDSKEQRDILKQGEIEELRKTASKAPPEVPSFERIILYIDDLDRCPPDKVVSVLQAIHLLLCFKLFVVVVAVDARWISRALIDQYPDLLEENVMWIEPRKDKIQDSQHVYTRVGASSHDYLEKIFQIPYWVRPMDKTACEKYVEHLTEVDQLKTAKNKPDNNLPPKDVDTPKPDDTEKLVPAKINKTKDILDGGDLIEPDKDKLDDSQQPNVKLPDVNLTSGADDYAGMYLTKNEVIVLKKMAQYAGSSPRRGLRFINVYRLIKSGLTKKQLADLVDDSGESISYKTIITQLAISTGAPKIAQYYFQLITGKDREIKSIAGLIREMEKETQITASPEWPQLKGALTELNALSKDENVGIGIIEALRKSAPIARRYSFTARPT